MPFVPCAYACASSSSFGSSSLLCIGVEDERVVGGRWCCRCCERGPDDRSGEDACRSSTGEAERDKDAVRLDEADIVREVDTEPEGELDRDGDREYMVSDSHCTCSSDG